MAMEYPPKSPDSGHVDTFGLEFVVVLLDYRFVFLVDFVPCVR